MASFQFVILNYRLRCFSWFPLWPVVLRVVWKTTSKMMDGFTLNLSICFHHLSCTGACRCLGVHPHCVKLKVGQLHLGLFATSSQGYVERQTSIHTGNHRTVGGKSGNLAGSQPRRHGERTCKPLEEEVGPIKPTTLASLTTAPQRHPAFERSLKIAP